jgi:predicted permease
MYARLQPEVSIERADAAMRVIASSTLWPDARKAAERSGWQLSVLSYAEAQVGPVRLIAYALAAAVLFVLMIACANLSGLMLARGPARARELAVRAALGVRRRELMRQALAERLLITGAGAVAGLGVAYAGLRLLIVIVPRVESPERILRIDGWMLLFLAVTAAGSGLWFGLLPAWRQSLLAAARALQEGGRSGPASVSRQRARSLLVVAEVALALVLLVKAGLFMRSHRNLHNVDPVFDTSGLITAELHLPPRPGPEAKQRDAWFHRDVVSRLRAIPGVARAAVANRFPYLGGDRVATFKIVGREMSGDRWIEGGASRVSADSFAVPGTAVLRGRASTELDGAGGEPVTLIDENMVHQHFATEEPLRQHIRFNGRNHRIIGVVTNLKQARAAVDRSRPMFYLPLYAEELPYGACRVRSGRGHPGVGNSDSPGCAKRGSVTGRV